jgi:membrane protease YdiL (CAAX protease family)
MKSTYPSRPDAAAVVVSWVVGLLLISNILVNRVLPHWSYVPWNLAVAATVVVLARRARTDAEMGLAGWRRGALLGGTIAAGVLVVYAVAAAIPATRDVFSDERVGEGWSFLVYHSLIRIPLGTVVLEELAFRAVLPALFTPPTSACHADHARSGRFRMTERVPAGVVRGVVVASLLFGLWHVLPAWNVSDVNPLVADVFGDDGVGQAMGVVMAVLGTFVAGLTLCVLRYWSGSVLAPILVHGATNSFGYAFAWSIG